MNSRDPGMQRLELTLDDIPICSLEALEALAAEAPAPPQSSRQPAKKPGRPSRGSSKPDLGPVHLEQYLTHYGVEYTVKPGAGKTIFKLHHCLFDPAHTRNEASIIQDAGGNLTYHCFHNSCKGRTWADARRQISGDKSLAEFCDGYDPEKSPARPAALNKDPEQPWLLFNDKGRATFNPAIFADHLAAQFQPLINEGGAEQFFCYNGSGFWRPLPEAAIAQVACEVLSENAKSARVADAMGLLRAKTFMPADKIVCDPLWVNVLNGMLHCESLELRSHGPEFNSRAQMPVRYDPAATCELWLKTLNEIFSDDPSKITTLQQFFGYCCFPKILFPCALFAIGRGANGKSTVMRVLECMLGNQNVSHLSLQRLADRWGPAELQDKLLNSCGETSERELDVTTFKNAVAGDMLQAERKYKGDVSFKPIAKFIFAMNSFPSVKDRSDGFFRRLIIVPFEQVFSDESADTRLPDRLIEELNGIFAWAIEGLRVVLQNKKIDQPESIVNAKRRFRMSVDQSLAFGDEVCDISDQAECFPATLYKRYVTWCGDSGISRPMAKARFYERIMSNFAVKRRRHKGSTQEHFEGISIRDEGDDPPF
jgi:P4 family phage/plasmid primase-like protien